jgi:hypothetical protein
MYAEVRKNKVLIYLNDNFIIVYSKDRVKVNDKVIFWYSPLTQIPIPIPIKQ